MGEDSQKTTPLRTKLAKPIIQLFNFINNMYKDVKSKLIKQT